MPLIGTEFESHDKSGICGFIIYMSTEHRRKGKISMQELDIDEIKKIELDILLDVANFCDEHKLKYFLAYGTLIGAVRHQGFIPWDDDIDIYMPRKDYQEFLRSYNKGAYKNRTKSKNYSVVCPYEKRAKHSFARVMDTRTVKIEPGYSYGNDYLGVDIDIFPLDGQPEGEEDFKIWYKKLIRLYLLFYFVAGNNRIGSYKHRITVFLAKPIATRKRLLNMAGRFHSKYPYETSKYVGSIEAYLNEIGDRFEKQCFEKSILLEFEGHKFRAPIGYDDVLKSIYGDYMKLPPPEERVGHRLTKMYWKENC